MKKKLLQRIKKLTKHFKIWRNGTSNLNMFLTCMSLVMIWRGIWHLLDYYLLPNHYVWNALIPLVIGLVYLFIDDSNLKELTK